MNKPAWKRPIALFTALTFLWTSFFWPTPSGYSEVPSRPPGLPDLASLKIPAELGRIEEVQIPQKVSSRIPILYIQDAHAVYDAQKSIQGIIDHFQKLYGLSFVAVEGAAGSLDPVLFRTFPLETTKQKVFEALIKKGELSGADAAAILNSGWSHFVGIEDKDLYFEDRAAYIEAIKAKPDVERELDKKIGANEELKAKTYSPELLALDQKVTAFEENSQDLFNFLSWLSQFEIPAANYPQLNLLIGEIKQEQTADAHLKAKGDVQLMKLAGEVKGQLDGNEKKEYISLYQNFRIKGQRKEFVYYLTQKAKEKKIPPEPYRDFLAQEKKHLKLEALAGGDFFKELKTFIEDQKKKLFRSEAQKKLDRRSHELKLLHKLASLEVTREELQEIKNFAPFSSPLATGTPHRARISPQDEAGRRRETESEFAELFRPHLKFYELALKRDQVLFENLTSEAAQKKAAFAVVVTGGFHAEGVKALLKENAYPYVLISPKIRELGESHYLDVMFEKNPSYQKYMKAASIKNSQIAAMDLLAPTIVGPDRWNAIKAAWAEELVEGASQEMNENDRENLLGHWRDLIVTAVLQNGLGNSQEYIRVIKEVHGGFVESGVANEKTTQAVIDLLQHFVNERLNPAQIQNAYKNFFQKVKEGLTKNPNKVEEAVRNGLEVLGYQVPSTEYVEPGKLAEAAREKLLAEVVPDMSEKVRKAARKAVGVASEILRKQEQAIAPLKGSELRPGQPSEGLVDQTIAELTGRVKELAPDLSENQVRLVALGALQGASTEMARAEVRNQPEETPKEEPQPDPASVFENQPLPQRQDSAVRKFVKTQGEQALKEGHSAILGSAQRISEETKGRIEAEDLAQKALEGLLRDEERLKARLRPGEDPDPYLKKVAKNKMLDAAREARREQETTAKDSVFDFPDRRAENPSESVVKAEQSQILRTEVSKLDDKEKDLLRRRFEEDQTIQQIADAYEIKFDEASRRLTEVLDKIRFRFQGAGRPRDQAKLEQFNERLSSLSPDLEQVMRLRYFDGLAYAEIAHSVNRPLGTVKRQINTAKQQLIERFEYKPDSDFKHIKRLIVLTGYHPSRSEVRSVSAVDRVLATIWSNEAQVPISFGDIREAMGQDPVKKNGSYHWIYYPKTEKLRDFVIKFSISDEQMLSSSLIFPISPEEQLRILDELFLKGYALQTVSLGNLRVRIEGGESRRIVAASLQERMLASLADFMALPKDQFIKWYADHVSERVGDSNLEKRFAQRHQRMRELLYNVNRNLWRNGFFDADPSFSNYGLTNKKRPGKPQRMRAAVMDADFIYRLPEGATRRQIFDFLKEHSEEELSRGEHFLYRIFDENYPTDEKDPNHTALIRIFFPNATDEQIAKAREIRTKVLTHKTRKAAREFLDQDENRAVIESLLVELSLQISNARSEVRNSEGNVPFVAEATENPNFKVYVVDDALYSILDPESLGPAMMVPKEGLALTGADSFMIQTFLRIAAASEKKSEKLFPGSIKLKQIVEQGDVILIKASSVLNPSGEGLGTVENFVRDTIWEEKVHLQTDRLDPQMQSRLFQVLQSSSLPLIIKAFKTINQVLGEDAPIEFRTNEVLPLILLDTRTSPAKIEEMLKRLSSEHPDIAALLETMRQETSPSPVEVARVREVAERLSKRETPVESYTTTLKRLYQSAAARKSRGPDSSSRAEVREFALNPRVGDAIQSGLAGNLSDTDFNQALVLTENDVSQRVIFLTSFMADDPATLSFRRRAYEEMFGLIERDFISYAADGDLRSAEQIQLNQKLIGVMNLAVTHIRSLRSEDEKGRQAHVKIVEDFLTDISGNLPEREGSKTDEYLFSSIALSKDTLYRVALRGMSLTELEMVVNANQFLMSANDGRFASEDTIDQWNSGNAAEGRDDNREIMVAVRAPAWQLKQANYGALGLVHLRDEKVTAQYRGSVEQQMAALESLSNEDEAKRHAERLEAARKSAEEEGINFDHEAFQRQPENIAFDESRIAKRRLQRLLRLWDRGNPQLGTLQARYVLWDQLPEMNRGRFDNEKERFSTAVAPVLQRGLERYGAEMPASSRNYSLTRAEVRIPQTVLDRFDQVLKNKIDRPEGLGLVERIMQKGRRLYPEDEGRIERETLLAIVGAGQYEDAGQSRRFLENYWNGQDILNEFIKNREEKNIIVKISRDKATSERLLKNGFLNVGWKVIGEGGEMIVFGSAEFPDIVLKAIRPPGRWNVSNVGFETAEKNVFTLTPEAYNAQELAILTGYRIASESVELKDLVAGSAMIQVESGAKLKHDHDNDEKNLLEETPFFYIEKRHANVPELGTREFKMDAFFKLFQELALKGYTIDDSFSPKQLGQSLGNDDEYVLLDFGKLTPIEERKKNVDDPFKSFTSRLRQLVYDPQYVSFFDSETSRNYFNKRVDKLESNLKLQNPSFARAEVRNLQKESIVFREDNARYPVWSMDEATEEERRSIQNYANKLRVMDGDSIADLFEQRIREKGFPLAVPEDYIDQTNQQRQMLASRAPLEYGPGVLYHGANDLDKIIVLGKLQGDIQKVGAPNIGLTRGGHTDTYPAVGKKPAIFVIDTNVFNAFLHFGHAGIMLNKEERITGDIMPFTTISEEVPLARVKEIWVPEDVFEEYEQLLKSEATDEKTRLLKEKVQALLAQGKIKPITGLRGRSPDKNEWESKVGRYIIARDFLVQIPSFEIKDARRSEARFIANPPLAFINPENLNGAVSRFAEALRDPTKISAMTPDEIAVGRYSFQLVRDEDTGNLVIKVADFGSDEMAKTATNKFVELGLIPVEDETGLQLARGLTQFLALGQEIVRVDPSKQDPAKLAEAFQAAIQIVLRDYSASGTSPPTTEKTRKTQSSRAPPSQRLTPQETISYRNRMNKINESGSAAQKQVERMIDWQKLKLITQTALNIRREPTEEEMGHFRGSKIGVRKLSEFPGLGEILKKQNIPDHYAGYIEITQEARRYMYQRGVFQTERSEGFMNDPGMYGPSSLEGGETNYFREVGSYLYMENRWEYALHESFHHRAGGKTDQPFIERMSYDDMNLLEEMAAYRGMNLRKDGTVRQSYTAGQKAEIPEYTDSPAKRNEVRLAIAAVEELDRILPAVDVTHILSRARSLQELIGLGGMTWSELREKFRPGFTDEDLDHARRAGYDPGQKAVFDLDQEARELGYIRSGVKNPSPQQTQAWADDWAFPRVGYLVEMGGRAELRLLKQWLEVGEEDPFLSNAVRKALNQFGVSGDDIKLRLRGLEENEKGTKAQGSLDVPKSVLEARLKRLQQKRGRIGKGEIPNQILVGDVHGDVELMKAVRSEIREMLQRGENPEVIFHGDLFDADLNMKKGPEEMLAHNDNLGVFRMVQEIKNELGDRAIFIVGNHDEWLIRAFVGGDQEAFANWFMNRGAVFFNQVEDYFRRQGVPEGQLPGKVGEKMREVANWLMNNQKLFHIDDMGLLHVHAVIPVDKNANPVIGIDELKRAQNQLAEAQREGNAEKIHEILGGPMQEVFWARDWEDQFRGDPQKIDHFMWMMEVDGLMVGHAHHQEILNLGNKIFGIDFGQRGFAVLDKTNGLQWREIAEGTPIGHLHISRNQMLSDLDREIEKLEGDLGRKPIRRAKELTSTASLDRLKRMVWIRSEARGFLESFDYIPQDIDRRLLSQRKMELDDSYAKYLSGNAREFLEVLAQLLADSTDLDYKDIKQEDISAIPNEATFNDLAEIYEKGLQSKQGNFEGVVKRDEQNNLIFFLKQILRRPGGNPDVDADLVLTRARQLRNRGDWNSNRRAEVRKNREEEIIELVRQIANFHFDEIIPEEQQKRIAELNGKLNERGEESDPEDVGLVYTAFVPESVKKDISEESFKEALFGDPPEVETALQRLIDRLGSEGQREQNLRLHDTLVKVMIFSLIHPSQKIRFAAVRSLLSLPKDQVKSAESILMRMAREEDTAPLVLFGILAHFENYQDANNLDRIINDPNQPRQLILEAVTALGRLNDRDEAISKLVKVIFDANNPNMNPKTMVAAFNALASNENIPLDVAAPILAAFMSADEKNEIGIGASRAFTDILTPRVDRMLANQPIRSEVRDIRQLQEGVEAVIQSSGRYFSHPFTAEAQRGFQAILDQANAVWAQGHTFQDIGDSENELSLHYAIQMANLYGAGDYRAVLDFFNWVNQKASESDQSVMKKYVIDDFSIIQIYLIAAYLSPERIREFLTDQANRNFAAFQLSKLSQFEGPRMQIPRNLPPELQDFASRGTSILMGGIVGKILTVFIKFYIQQARELQSQGNYEAARLRLRSAAQLTLNLRRIGEKEGRIGTVSREIVESLETGMGEFKEQVDQIIGEIELAEKNPGNNRSEVRNFGNEALQIMNEGIGEIHRQIDQIVSDLPQGKEQQFIWDKIEKAYANLFLDLAKRFKGPEFEFLKSEIEAGRFSQRLVIESLGEKFYESGYFLFFGVRPISIENHFIMDMPFLSLFSMEGANPVNFNFFGTEIPILSVSLGKPVVPSYSQERLGGDRMVAAALMDIEIESRVPIVISNQKSAQQLLYYYQLRKSVGETGELPAEVSTPYQEINDALKQFLLNQWPQLTSDPQEFINKNFMDYKLMIILHEATHVATQSREDERFTYLMEVGMSKFLWLRLFDALKNEYKPGNGWSVSHLEASKFFLKKFLPGIFKENAPGSIPGIEEELHRAAAETYPQGYPLALFIAVSKLSDEVLHRSASRKFLELMHKEGIELRARSETRKGADPILVEEQPLFATEAPTRSEVRNEDGSSSSEIKKPGKSYVSKLKWGDNSPPIRLNMETVVTVGLLGIRSIAARDLFKIQLHNPEAGIVALTPLADKNNQSVAATPILLEPGQSYKIGRHPTNNLIINDQSLLVSRFHGILTVHSNSWVSYRDAGSRFGSLLEVQNPDDILREAGSPEESSAAELRSNLSQLSVDMSMISQESIQQAGQSVIFNYSPEKQFAWEKALQELLVVRSRFSDLKLKRRLGQIGEDPLGEIAYLFAYGEVLIDEKLFGNPMQPYYYRKHGHHPNEIAVRASQAALLIVEELKRRTSARSEVRNEDLDLDILQHEVATPVGLIQWALSKIDSPELQKSFGDLRKSMEVIFRYGRTIQSVSSNPAAYHRARKNFFVLLGTLKQDLKKAEAQLRSEENLRSPINEGLFNFGLVGLGLAQRRLTAYQKYIRSGNFKGAPKLTRLDRNIQIVRPYYEQNGFQMEVIVERDVDPVIFADGDHLIGVWDNLIRNATKAGATKILFRIYKSKEEGRLGVAVSDNGKGIPKGLKIFDKGVSSKPTSGVPQGIGLYVVKAIVEAADGTITARNRREGGAIFNLTFPIARSEARAPSKEEGWRPQFSIRSLFTLTTFVGIGLIVAQWAINDYQRVHWPADRESTDAALRLMFGAGLVVGMGLGTLIYHVWTILTLRKERTEATKPEISKILETFLPDETLSRSEARATGEEQKSQKEAAELEEGVLEILSVFKKLDDRSPKETAAAMAQLRSLALRPNHEFFGLLNDPNVYLAFPDQDVTRNIAAPLPDIMVVKIVPGTEQQEARILVTPIDVKASKNSFNPRQIQWNAPVKGKNLNLRLVFKNGLKLIHFEPVEGTDPRQLALESYVRSVLEVAIDRIGKKPQAVEEQDGFYIVPAAKGWNKNSMIGSEGNNFLLRPNALELIRNLSSFRSEVRNEITREITVTNENGIHWRIAMEAVEAVQRYLPDTQIEFFNEAGRKLDAGSIIHLAAEGIKAGEKLNLKAKGPGAQQMLDEIEKILTGQKPAEQKSFPGRRLGPTAEDMILRAAAQREINQKPPSRSELRNEFRDLRKEFGNLIVYEQNLRKFISRLESAEALERLQARIFNSNELIQAALYRIHSKFGEEMQDPAMAQELQKWGEILFSIFNSSLAITRAPGARPALRRAAALILQNSQSYLVAIFRALTSAGLRMKTISRQGVFTDEESGEWKPASKEIILASLDVLTELSKRSNGLLYYMSDKTLPTEDEASALSILSAWLFNLNGVLAGRLKETQDPEVRSKIIEALRQTTAIFENKIFSSFLDALTDPDVVSPLRMEVLSDLQKAIADLRSVEAPDILTRINQVSTALESRLNRSEARNKNDRPELWAMLLGADQDLDAYSVSARLHPFYPGRYFTERSDKGKDTQDLVVTLLPLNLFEAVVKEKNEGQLRVAGNQEYDPWQNRIGIGEYPIVFPHEVGHWLFMRKLVQRSGKKNLRGKPVSARTFWRGHSGEVDKLPTLTEDETPSLISQYQQLVGAETPQMLKAGPFSRTMSLNENMAFNIERLTYAAPFVVNDSSQATTLDILNFFIKNKIITKDEARDYLRLSRRLNNDQWVTPLPMSQVKISIDGSYHVQPSFAWQAYFEKKIMDEESRLGRSLNLAEEIALRLEKDADSSEDVSRWLKEGKGKQIIGLLDLKKAGSRSLYSQIQNSRAEVRQIDNETWGKINQKVKQVQSSIGKVILPGEAFQIKPAFKGIYSESLREYRGPSPKLWTEALNNNNEFGYKTIFSLWEHLIYVQWELTHLVVLNTESGEFNIEPSFDLSKSHLNKAIDVLTETIGLMGEEFQRWYEREIKNQYSGMVTHLRRQLTAIISEVLTEQGLESTDLYQLERAGFIGEMAMEQALTEEVIDKNLGSFQSFYNKNRLENTSPEITEGQIKTVLTEALQRFGRERLFQSPFRAEVRKEEVKKNEMSQEDFDRLKTEASRFLFSLRNLTPKEEINEEAGVRALVEILRSGRFEPFENEFNRALQSKIEDLQKKGQLEGINPEIEQFLADPSPEALQGILTRREISISEDERNRLFNNFRELNIGANETVISSAAEKELQNLMNQNPALVAKAVANTFGRIQSVVAESKGTDQPVRVILRIGALGEKSGIFQSLAKYLGTNDRGMLNGEIIVTLVGSNPEHQKLRGISQIAARSGKIQVRFDSVPTTETEMFEISRLSAGSPNSLVITPDDLKKNLNQALHPDILPVESLNKAIDEILALVGVTLVRLGDPKKSPQAGQAMERLRQQLSDYGISVQQGNMGNWTVRLELQAFARRIGIELAGMQAQRVAA